MTKSGDAGEALGCEQCRAPYMELLAASYNEAERQPLHQLLVDSYFVQHPGGSDHRSVQRLSICLMTLGMFVEDDADPRLGPQLHRRMVAHGGFRPLEPRPTAEALHARMSAADVAHAADVQEYRTLLTSWGAQVWEAWSDHHAEVRGWIGRSLS
ncbi:DUF5946 family protein [Streptomyces sp. NPDC059176]|uniref:DUF5946 family protein n=1 Tax=unclassified Streptomyces TaxID=2593676 RepID=UPI0036C4EDF6